MIITLESTTKIITLRTATGDIPARIWQGVTASWIPIHAYITRIVVDAGADCSDLERELQECKPLSPAVEAIPMRMVL